MTPDPNFGPEQLLTELIRGVVDTVADHPGLNPEQRFLRQQTAVYSVMGFQPRDPVETMLAGHCVIYDHMLRDGARDLLRGQAEKIKLRSRPGTLASGKMFLTALDTLLRMQNRGADMISTLSKAAQPKPPRETAPEQQTSKPPLAATPPAPVRPEKPRFVCERVHPPRRPETAHAPRFGAAFRLPVPRQPVPSRRGKFRGPTLRSLLLGTVSHIAMRIAQAIPIGAEAEPIHYPAGPMGRERVPMPQQVETFPVPFCPQAASRATQITQTIRPAPIDGT